MLGIVKTDVGYHLSEQGKIIGYFSVLDPFSQKIAENSPEILMPGIGEKTTGIRNHFHKPGEQSQIGQSRHLANHPVLLVIKPPAGTELNLSRNDTPLKATEDSPDNFIIPRIAAIKNRFG